MTQDESVPRQTGNGPTDPNENAILEIMFGEPVKGVYAPRADDSDGDNMTSEGGPA